MASKKSSKYLLLGIFYFCLAFQHYSQNIGCQHAKSVFSPPGLYYSAENLRSDTFDILKYTINLEIGNTTSKIITGNTVIRFVPKMNGQNFIRFDLLKLTIDSIKENGNLLLYSYNDTVVKVNFATPKNTTDTTNLTVYYKGQPQGDASGWGGFYFDNTGGAQYAYNLGVGFAAKPHNYGRVWFPCFDNFVERSKYEFNITSDTARRAYCNGQLLSDVVNGNKRTRQWILNYEIPTYLASVSLANYKQVNWTVNTLSGVKPITLVAAGNDTIAMKAGFVNLKNCINGFENYYGPYMWNRFGYCAVPFNSGAMEHATNIAYPKAVLGSLAYEAELMAHELSHHWWGDLITCETQEDMWINEGMASYSQYMFLEWQYGKAKYLNDMKIAHDDLIHFLFKKEGFRAISGIPHNLTYGDHVYKKGADVAHTLRSYMGDTAFFNAIKYTMNQNQFKSVNTIQLQNMFQTSSGQNLSSFFTNWVLSAGWPHFAIDSVKYVQTGANSYDAIVSIQQKKFGAPSYYSNVPLEISFFKNDWSRVVKKVTMSGQSSTFTLSIPYSPAFYSLNYDSKINDATSFENKTIKFATNIGWNLGKVFFKIQNSGADSSLIRVVHHYVKPDPFKSNPQNHKLSDQHYWTIEGILSPGFHSKARFNYDGNKMIGGTYSYLDTLLTPVNGDSVRVFYRKDATDDWKLIKNCFRYSSGSKTGFIEIDTLKLGEYTLGNSTDTALVSGITKNQFVINKVKMYPNPAHHNFKIETEKNPVKTELIIINAEGRLIYNRRVTDKTTSVDISQFAPGAYFVEMKENDELIYSNKLIVN